MTLENILVTLVFGTLSSILATGLWRWWDSRANRDWRESKALKLALRVGKIGPLVVGLGIGIVAGLYWRRTPDGDLVSFLGIIVAATIAGGVWVLFARMRPPTLIAHMAALALVLWALSRYSNPPGNQYEVLVQIATAAWFLAPAAAAPANAFIFILRSAREGKGRLDEESVARAAVPEKD